MYEFKCLQNDIFLQGKYFDKNGFDKNYVHFTQLNHFLDNKLIVGKSLSNVNTYFEFIYIYIQLKLNIEQFGSFQFRHYWYI